MDKDMCVDIDMDIDICMDITWTFAWTWTWTFAWTWTWTWTDIDNGHGPKMVKQSQYSIHIWKHHFFTTVVLVFFLDIYLILNAFYCRF